MPDIIKAGDRVRITIEGIADEVLAGESYGEHPEPRGFDARSSEGDKVTIEKIEPPVEVFGPGDVVRPRAGMDHSVRVLGRDGYLLLWDGRFYKYDDRASGAYKARDFTSRRWERVAVG